MIATDREYNGESSAVALPAPSADGFYPGESDAEGAFRWTRPAFRLRPGDNARFAVLRLCYLGTRGRLRFESQGAVLDEVELRQGWQDCLAKVYPPGLDPRSSAPAAVMDATIRPTVAIAGDARQLGVALREVQWLAELPLFISADPLAQDGYYPTEMDAEGEFRWTRGRFLVRPEHPARFMALRLCYPGPQGTLRLSTTAGPWDEAAVGPRWEEIVLRLPECGAPLTVDVSPLFRIAGESRELGVMLRRPRLFDDPRRYEILSQAKANAVLNESEYRGGLPTLRSFPPAIRLTTEVRCNLPETSQPCTYCSWDSAKRKERGSPAFRPETLDEMGGFYRAATSVQDCSIGEPLMHKQFGKIVAAIDADGKSFGLTSNGQLLVEHRRRELLGKNVVLYVSIDAASTAGFARYRNDRFEDIIENLRALCRDKRAAENQPRVIASFIVMHSNVAELPEYFRLMKDIGVDAVKLRCLYLDDLPTPSVIFNNGYRFDYRAEVLTLDELDALIPVANGLAAEHALPVHIEWQDFESDRPADDSPLCAEPWKTLYMLRRGIMPCCYGFEPLVPLDQQGNRTLEQFLQDVFNGPEMQHIRSELAAGRLAAYCRNSQSCPITKRLGQGRGEPAAAEPQEERATLALLPIVTLGGPPMGACIGCR